MTASEKPKTTRMITIDVLIMDALPERMFALTVWGSISQPETKRNGGRAVNLSREVVENGPSPLQGCVLGDLCAFTRNSAIYQKPMRAAAGTPGFRLPRRRGVPAASHRTMALATGLPPSVTCWHVAAKLCGSEIA